MKLLLLIICGMFLLVSGRGEVITARQKFFREIPANPDAVRKYLTDKDPEIRRYAVYTLIKNQKTFEFDVISAAVNDPDEQVALTAVSLLPSFIGKDKRVMPLLQHLAKNSKFKQVRQIAVQSTWPFHRENRRLRDDPTWDYEVKTVKSLPLTDVPWLFRTDVMQDGHLKGFFKPDTDLSSWKKIKMGVWEEQGFADYDGVAWYTIKFTMPEKIDSNAVEAAFEAVDESAWVWLNGTYLGAHDIGPEGWKEPFALDCTREILWGKENTLTIRVYDAAYAGGIYKPVRIDILK